MNPEIVNGREGLFLSSSLLLLLFDLNKSNITVTFPGAFPILWQENQEAFTHKASLTVWETYPGKMLGLCVGFSTQSMRSTHTSHSIPPSKEDGPCFPESPLFCCCLLESLKTLRMAGSAPQKRSHPE